MAEPSFIIINLATPYFRPCKCLLLTISPPPLIRLSPRSLSSVHLLEMLVLHLGTPLIATPSSIYENFFDVWYSFLTILMFEPLLLLINHRYFTAAELTSFRGVNIGSKNVGAGNFTISPPPIIFQLPVFQFQIHFTNVKPLAIEAFPGRASPVAPPLLEII